jgi:hypothetical protein
VLGWKKLFVLVGLDRGADGELGARYLIFFMAHTTSLWEPNSPWSSSNILLEEWKSGNEQTE